MMIEAASDTKTKRAEDFGEHAIDTMPLATDAYTL